MGKLDQRKKPGSMRVHRKRVYLPTVHVRSDGGTISGKASTFKSVEHLLDDRRNNPRMQLFVTLPELGLRHARVEDILSRFSDAELTSEDKVLFLLMRSC